MRYMFCFYFSVFIVALDYVLYVSLFICLFVCLSDCMQEDSIKVPAGF